MSKSCSFLNTADICMKNKKCSNHNLNKSCDDNDRKYSPLIPSECYTSIFKIFDNDPNTLSHKIDVICSIDGE